MSKKNPYVLNGKIRTTACVGTNGGTYDEYIRSGFHEAIPGIIKQVYETGSSDILVYPLVFCARHSVELGLKIILRAILNICLIKGQKPEDIEHILKNTHTHDVMRLSNEINLHLSVDGRLKEYYEPIEEYLDDYAIDPEGDAFRYAFSTSNVPHMESRDITHVSLDIFSENYFEISKRIDGCILALNYFNMEYRLGTFTRSLSRHQIEEISLLIGDIQIWNTDKEEIKRRYNISSKELTDAVNIIKEHWSFSANIGMERPYPGISNEGLIAYKEYAQKMTDAEYKSKKNTPFGEFEEVTHDKTAFDQAQNEFLAIISYNELVFLVACIEIAKREELFSEHLDEVIQEFNEGYSSDCSRLVHKLGFGRLNAYLLKGLSICGQTTYLKLLR